MRERCCRPLLAVRGAPPPPQASSRPGADFQHLNTIQHLLRLRPSPTHGGRPPPTTLCTGERESTASLARRGVVSPTLPFAELHPFEDSGRQLSPRALACKVRLMTWARPPLIAILKRLTPLEALFHHSPTPKALPLPPQICVSSVLKPYPSRCPVCLTSRLLALPRQALATFYLL